MTGHFCVCVWGLSFVKAYINTVRLRVCMLRVIGDWEGKNTLWCWGVEYVSVACDMSQLVLANAVSLVGP